MERTLLETVHLLGLDVEIAIVAALVALEALRRLVEHWRAAGHAGRPGVVGAILPPAPTWPPEGWRANH